MAIVATFLEEGKQSPDDVVGRLAQFLSVAKTSLHVAIYDCRLSDAPARAVVQALEGPAAAGVDVRIVYDAGKPSNPAALGVDPAPPGTAAFMKGIVGKVQSKAITGGHLHQPRLMHHKYIVRDGLTPGGAVWTGSTNFTDDSWALQENNIICIDSPELCAYYEKDFGELWTRGDIDTTGARDRGTVHVGEAVVSVTFAPGDGQAIDHEIAHRISAARRRLRICSMLITSGGILGALGDALHHGQVAAYGGIYDRTQMESVFDQWRGSPVEWKIGAFQQIAGGLAGKRSTPYTPGGRHDFMHNKVLVCDDTVITGSYNLSHSATENAENVLMIQDRELADRYDGYATELARRYGASVAS
jgi:phosphatidylserine/phosphatidylglycerophosphate/cardiolipin synthase-like enzyme